MVRKHLNGLKPVMAEPLVVNGRHEGKGREEGPFSGSTKVNMVDKRVCMVLIVFAAQRTCA